MDTKNATAQVVKAFEDATKVAAQLELATEMLARAASEYAALELECSKARGRAKRAQRDASVLKHLLERVYFSQQTGEPLSAEVEQAVINELAPEGWR